MTDALLSAAWGSNCSLSQVTGVDALSATPDLLKAMHNCNHISVQDSIICQLLLQADKRCDSELGAFALTSCKEGLEEILQWPSQHPSVGFSLHQA